MAKIMTLSAVAVLAMLAADAAWAAINLDVTVTSPTGSNFSAPVFTFTNQSDAGIRINAVQVSSGPPWDFVINGGAFPSALQILDPAGGSRTITLGQESSFDANDGCSAGIGYSLTSFDPGDVFRFAADPETPACQSAIVDIRPFLLGDQISISGTFSNGATLTGSDWTLELIDPNGSPTADVNQRFRLTLEADAPIPEPQGWMMMIAGFGLIGAALRRHGGAKVAAAPQA
jgi:hypothetical protein